MNKFFLALLMVSSMAHAQSAPVDSPPNEPPYTSTDDEFSATSATPPVDLNTENTNEKTIEDLMSEGKEAAASEPAVIEAPPQEIPVAPTPVQAPKENYSASSSESYPESSSSVMKQAGDGRTKYIHHPLAKKGLQLIDKDGSYYYAPTRFSKKEQTSSLKIGSIKPPSIVSQDGQTDYVSMYGSGNPITVLFDYDWKPFQSFGALGLQGGIGFFTAKGTGRFADPSLNPGVQPLESYTFYALPLSLGGIYRFEYMDRQWIAPYIAGGGTFFALVEMRDDGKSPTIAGSPAVYGAGGLMINLSAIDKDTGFQLDREYGISTLWLNGEVRQIQCTNKDLDLSGTLFSVGLSFDY